MSHKILVGLGTAAGGVAAAGLISRSGLARGTAQVLIVIRSGSPYSELDHTLDWSLQ
jgi:hypothetical protein